MPRKNASFNIRKSIVGLLLALVVFFGFSVPAQAATGNGNASISVAPYIHTTQLQNLDASWNLDLPLAKSMEPFKDLMKEAGAAGLYPHGRGGKNKIAYIEYNVTFPEGVTPDMSGIKLTNTCSFINGNGITYNLDGQVLKFKIPLIDVNWQGIYDAWSKDITDPNSHTIKCVIPYKVANSSDAATEITSSGNFAFYPAGWQAAWGIGLKVYDTDVAHVPVFGGQAKTSSTISVPDNTFNLGILNLNEGSSGSVLGNYMQVAVDNQKAYVVPAEDIVNVCATLNVQPVKEQLASIQNKISIPLEYIGLNDVSSRFTATFTLPKGLSFDEDAEPLLVGDNGFYTIESYHFNDNELVVDMTLNNSEDIHTMSDLAEAVEGMNDALKVDFIVKVDPTNKTNLYPIDGKFDSELSAKVVLGTSSGLDFKLGWIADGDVLLTNPVDIEFSSADENQGTVDNAGQTVTCVTPDGEVYSTATPKPGYEFDYWMDNANNKFDTATLTVHPDKDGAYLAQSYVAYFKKKVIPTPEPQPQPEPKPLPQPESNQPSKPRTTPKKAVAHKVPKTSDPLLASYASTLVGFAFACTALGLVVSKKK